MSAEEIIDELRFKQIDNKWKSDVDLKLDRLVRFADKYERFLEIMTAREEKRVRLWDAIIEKTLGALILAGVVGLLSLAWNGLTMDLKAIFQSVRK